MAVLRTAQVAVSAVAQPLTAVALEVSSFLLKAPSTNTDDVELGPSTLTAGEGYPLAPGEVFRFDFGNEAGEQVFDYQPQDVYVVGTEGDSVAWIAAGRP